MCQLVLIVMYGKYSTIKWNQVANIFLIDGETAFLWVHWIAILKMQREKSTVSSDKEDYKEAAAHLKVLN